MSDGEPEDKAHRLSQAQRWGSVAVLLAIFLFGGGQPVWEDPFHVDRSAWLSYLAIPLLVAAWLWRDKKLGWLSLALNTMELTALKFGISYLFTLALWATSGGPPPPVRTQLGWLRATGVNAPDPPDSAPEPTPWPADRMARLRGRVLRADQPLADALVFVEDGLGELTFAPPQDPVQISLGADGFDRRIYVAHSHQRIAARADDGVLHSLFMATRDRERFNVPLLPSGSWRSIATPEAGTFVDLRCMAHLERKAGARLAVLGHPFHALSDKHGRFEWPQIPALALRISVWHREAGRTSVAIELKAGGDHETLLRY